MAPGSQRDVGDQPRDGALAVGARDRHDRDPPISVADPGRRCGPRVGDALGPARQMPFLGTRQPRGPRRRHVPIGEGEGGLGQGERPFGPQPREGDDPVARVRRAMHREAGTSFTMLRPEAAQPGDDPRHRVRPVACGHVRAQVHERVPRRIALPVPGAPAPEGDFDLDHRLQPVDVGSFKQSCLDQSHGPGRIASRCGLDCAPWTFRPPCRARLRPIELTALQAAVAADFPAYLEDLRELVDLDCGSYTPEGVNQVADWASDFLGALGAAVERRAGSRRPPGRHRRRHVRRPHWVDRGSCSSATWTPCSTPAPPPSARSACRTASPTARA